MFNIIYRKQQKRLIFNIYLGAENYHTIEGFADKLDKIIEEDDNKDIWL